MCLYSKDYMHLQKPRKKARKKEKKTEENGGWGNAALKL